MASSSALSVLTSMSFCGFVEQEHISSFFWVMARCTLFRSPPDSTPSFFCWSDPEILNLPCVLPHLPWSFAMLDVCSIDNSFHDTEFRFRVGYVVIYTHAFVVRRLHGYRDHYPGFLGHDHSKSVDLPTPFGPYDTTDPHFGMLAATWPTTWLTRILFPCDFVQSFFLYQSLDPPSLSLRWNK